MVDICMMLQGSCPTCCLPDTVIFMLAISVTTSACLLLRQELMPQTQQRVMFSNHVSADSG